MSSVIITVVVVLGIIVAGGFLLYFMGDLFMSLSHKKKDEDAINKKQAEETEELKKRIDALEKSDELKKDPEVATILYNGAVVENYNPNEDEQEVEEEPEEQIEEPETVEEEAEEPAQEEEPAEETEEEDDTADFIKQRRQELMERLARMQNAQEEEEEEPEEEETVDLTEEQPEETTEQETTEETNVEEQPTVPATTEETFEQAKTDANALANAMTLEELESKLAEEQDRLKANEKELRQCKKEFIPLRRIKRTLESDKKKLQRKEALVAKQKTVLYGVNNYADLDEEKAKKLAEDLDLYDGLKLSVQHCEEVMEKNEDRYPLLEKIFNLLTTQNAEIKEDIKNLQEAIDSLKADDSTDETADAE